MRAFARLPPRIRIGKSVVMLNHDAKLYPHHIDDSAPFRFDKPVAEVSQHPSDPTRWGLKNLSGEQWAATSSDGTARDVEPGRNVPLAVGTRIHFGKAEGESGCDKVGTAANKAPGPESGS